MIHFAHLDSNGFPTGGGVRRALPDGAVALAPPFTTLDLPRLMFRDGAWVERPVLPKAEPTDGGFRVFDLPKGAEIVVTDLGSGTVITDTAEGAAFGAPLPDDCTVEVTVTAPRPWVPSVVKITRGKGAPEIVSARLALARSTAISRINDHAGKLRLMIYTDIPGQDALYLEKRAEAKAYVREAEQSGEPATLEDYPLLAGEVGVTAPTAWQLAQIWLFRSDQFKRVGAATEQARMRASIAVTTAPDQDAIDIILAAFTEAIGSLTP